MSFDYLKDIFGKSRKGRTRFSDMEKKAIDAIKDYLKGKVDAAGFVSIMLECRKQMDVLMTDENGTCCFDKDTPLWFNNFFGYAFFEWHKVWKYEQAIIEQRPDMMAQPDWHKFKALVHQKEESMRMAMETILKNVRIPSKWSLLWRRK